MLSRLLNLAGLSRTPLANEHDVSFDLTTKQVSRPRSCITGSASPACRRLPQDVVYHILEAAYYGADMQPDNKTLSSAALVCSEWSFPAQMLLFRNVSLRTEADFASFSSAVDGSASLAGQVVTLKAVVDRRRPDGLTPVSFSRAVAMCGNLFDLNLSLYGFEAGSDMDAGVTFMESLDAASVARLMDGPRITSLRLSNWSQDAQVLPQLLGLWPSISRLAVSGHAPEVCPTTTAAPPCTLSELRLNFVTSPSDEFMKWLLHASTSSLEILELERDPSSKMLEYLAEMHGSTLLSLAIPTCRWPEHIAAIRKCNALRELKVEFPSTSPAAFRGVSEGLEHLAFGVERNAMLGSVLDLVKRQKEVKAVTLHMWESGEAFSGLPLLKIACAFRGIELRIIQDVQVFRTVFRGDPISSTSFPRVKSLSNLNTMRSARH